MNAQPATRVRTLRAAWDAATAAYQRNDSDANREAEQNAYDELVDYIEANELNGTAHDPRGPE